MSEHHARRPSTNPLRQAPRTRTAVRAVVRRLAGATAVALGVLSTADASLARAQDISNGADNFYVSDQVTVRKVTFKNQYQMNVAGNLFIPKTLDRSAKHAAIIVGH